MPLDSWPNVQFSLLLKGNTNFIYENPSRVSLPLTQYTQCILMISQSTCTRRSLRHLSLLWVGLEERETALRDAEELAAAAVSASNLGRMRRRFNELVDDAFSLFGSRSVSPESSSPPPSVGHRGHSAIVRYVLPCERLVSPCTAFKYQMYQAWELGN